MGVHFSMALSKEITPPLSQHQKIESKAKIIILLCRWKLLVGGWNGSITVYNTWDSEASFLWGEMNGQDIGRWVAKFNEMGG